MQGCVVRLQSLVEQIEHRWPCLLQIATKTAHAEVIKELLAAKAKVNARSKEHGMTALHVSVSSGHEDMEVHGIAMDLLLKAGAKVNAKDFNGVAPLHLAVYTENTVAVELLGAAGANMNVGPPPLPPHTHTRARTKHSYPHSHP